MSDKRTFRWATTSARMLGGTLVGAAFVIAVVTAVSVPWPEIDRSAPAIEEYPAADQSIAACTGDILATGRDVEDAGEIVSAADATLTLGTSIPDTDPEVSDLPADALGDEQSASAVVAAPDGEVRVDVAGAGAATVSDEDLRGYAASPCRTALMESWLVAGSTATGSADLVLLTNPGEVAATVQLTVYGAQGETQPPGGADVVVAAGTQRIVPLAGLILGEASPVVRVTAVGAPVQASVQSSITRGLIAGGVEQTTAVASPDTTQVITGISVAEAPADGGEAGTVLRMLAPSGDATANIRVTAADAVQPVVLERSIELTGGVPAEAELGGLDVGQYTVEATAETEIVASVWQSTGSGEAADFAWYMPAPSLGAPTTFATPAGLEPQLTLANVTDADMTIDLATVDGEQSQQVDVAAHTSTTVRLTARTVYRIDDGGGGVHAGLSLSGDGALAGYPVWPSEAASDAIVVYP
ncbi:DUF5719 family protein [Microbacterium aquimaris]|uniref:DUF5719 family protein n=1 Tax=Microbacterium aquimaris TaxID=459816 RepID=UPI002AD4F820|nr:DUF5719 family protein [Microbacterium aquimaris]MDZ8274528.1 DUF5719 family protein [Microbacterium aquimaris]